MCLFLAALSRHQFWWQTSRLFRSILNKDSSARVGREIRWAEDRWVVCRVTDPRGARAQSAPITRPTSAKNARFAARFAGAEWRKQTVRFTSLPYEQFNKNVYIVYCVLLWSLPLHLWCVCVHAWVRVCGCVCMHDAYMRACVCALCTHWS